MDVLNLNLTPWSHVSFPYITSFDIKINDQRIQTTSSHDHVVNIKIIFIIVILTLCYFKLKHISLIFFYHACMLNATKLLDITSTLVATSVIVWSLECITSYLLDWYLKTTPFPKLKSFHSRLSFNQIHIRVSHFCVCPLEILLSADPLI